MVPRIFNMLVGAWLILSALAWPHTVTERTNTIICGVLAIGLALAAICSRHVRYGNAALAVWLSVSTLLTSPLGQSNKTLWNNCFAAAAIFLAAFLGRGRRREDSAAGL